MNISSAFNFFRKMGESLPQIAVETPPALIEFRKPSEIQSYEPPEGAVLVGDSHLVRGAVSVLAGAPGVGKSRAGLGLAIAGSRAAPWFGLPVHKRFRTAIIQCENGSLRLKREFEDIGIPDLDDYIRISPPPEGGLEFFQTGFIAAVKAMLVEFKPDLVVIDPWTATVTDDKSRDYRETLQQLRRVIGAGDNAPAILIIAHTRKPKGGEKLPVGRSLMHEVAGSYVLCSAARSIFLLLPASDASDDDRVVFVNSKNNDGEMVPRSAWHRRSGLFACCSGFDWRKYDQQSGATGRASITVEDIREVFALFGGKLSRKEAAERLELATGCSRTVAYDALKIPGKFAQFLNPEGKNLCWVESGNESESECA